MLLEEPAFSIGVAAAQDDNEIKQTPNAKPPAGKKLYDADDDVSHVKMMHAKQPKEKTQDEGNDLGFGWGSVDYLLDRLSVLLLGGLGVLLLGGLCVLLLSGLSRLLGYRQG